MNQNRNMSKILIRGLVLALCTSFGHPALAQDSEPSVEDVRQAGDEFNLGRAAFKDEDYSTAAEHFEKADSLAPNPKVLLLAIQARSSAGHASRAATLAALAQDRYPAEDLFADTRELITAALREQAKLKVQCESPCTVLVDGRLVHGQPSTKRFIFLDPGEYTVRAAFGSGGGQSRSFSAIAGESGKLVFGATTSDSAVGGLGDAGGQASEDEEQIDWGDEPADDDGLPKQKITYDELGADQAPADGETARSGLPPVVFWTGMGLTLVAAGVSTWSGIDAQNDPGPERVRDACSNDDDDCESLYQQGQDAELRTNVLWGVTAGVGVVSVLLGAVWTDWGPPSHPMDTGSARQKRRQMASVEPWFSFEDGAAVGARGRF